MLFDDEIEILEEDKKYPECFAVPMQWHISIKDIWIPAHLLPNRQKALDSDRAWPNIYHTLNKPKVESFSTYEETEANKNYVKLHSSNYNTSSDCQGKTFDSQCNDKVKSSAALDSANVGNDSNNLDSHKHNSNSEINISGKGKKKKRGSKNSLDIVNKKMPSDFINSGLLEASKEPSNDDLLCMLLNSETSEVASNETEIASMDHTTDKSSDLLNTTTQDKEQCSDTISSEVPHLNSTEANCCKETDSANYLETADQEKTAEDSTTSSLEVLEILPVPYKKQVVEEKPTKQKRQKEKKKKNAVNKAIQLGEFLDSPNVDGYEIPKRDLFYEGLVAQGLAPPIENPYNSKSSNTCYEFPNLDSPSLYENYDSLFSEECAAYEKFSSEEPKDLGPDEPKESFNDIENGVLTTLVLENIPTGTSKDNIATLMSDYGNIKDISLIKTGRSLKSYIKLILQYEAEWIIECLNGTDPFGASCENLKCYQI